MGARAPRRRGHELTELVLHRVRQRRELAVLATGMLAMGGGFAALLGPTLLALPGAAVGCALIGSAVNSQLLWHPMRAAAAGAVYAGVAGIWGFLLGVGGGVILGTIACGALAAGGAARLLRARDLRLVRSLEAAHAGGRPLEPIVDAIARTSRPVVFETGMVLQTLGRYDLIEPLMARTPLPAAWDSIRQLYVAIGRLGLGEIDGADDIADTADHQALGAALAEEWDQLSARIRIARGDAAAVLADFPGECAHREPGLVMRRILVLADAHAATGDLTTARAMLADIGRAPNGPAILAALKQQRRPIAAIAADVLAGDAGPYR